MFKTIIIHNDPAVALDAQAAGITRIMVDLESHGKKERQASRQTFISTHQPPDVAKIRAVLTTSDLLVRINPWHSHSEQEIDHAVDNGADIVMLPMITQLSHLDDFLSHLNGRAKPLPLLETSYSMAHVGTITAMEAINEVYIGLNDLHLSLGLDFLFEPLSLGLIDWMASQITAFDKDFGFGGLATMGSGELPAERLLGEHARLGSSCVILSSRFCKDVAIEQPEGRRERLTDAMNALQVNYHQLCKRPPMEQHEDAKRTFAMINKLAATLRKKGVF